MNTIQHQFGQILVNQTISNTFKDANTVIFNEEKKHTKTILWNLHNLINRFTAKVNKSFNFFLMEILILHGVH